MKMFVNLEEVLLLIEDFKNNKNVPKNYGTLLDILREIRKLPRIELNDWIPCDKKLPTSSGPYHVTRRIKDIDSNKVLYETTYEHFWTKSGLWDSQMHGNFGWEIIAWKKSDEPYILKEDKEEK